MRERSLTPRAMVALSCGAAYLATQMWHTLSDRNRWPFCTYNMFSYQLEDCQDQQRARLVTDRGAVLGPVPVWGLLPIEFFRVESVLSEVLFDNTDAALRDQFCAKVVARLNTRGWSSWDEVRASFRPPRGHRIAALEVYRVEVDFQTHDPWDPCQVVKACLVHRYDPEGVTALTAPPAWRVSAGR